MISDVALSVNGVSKTFGTTHVLHNISLQINKGEIVCLVGSSGCGKSTLLRIIGGVELPDEGAIFINGHAVVGPGQFVEPDKRNIGFVFQDYALFPHLDVASNVAFGLNNLNKDESAERVRFMLDHVGLSQMAHRYPHMLSGGEQQRVALARALAPLPSIILMDEPFSNLDQGLREVVRAETLAILKRLNTTAILVTHDPQEALSAGDRVVLMHNGEIVQSGIGSQIFHSPISPYVAEFFGSVNHVTGTVKQSFVETCLGAFPNSMNFPDGGIVDVYVRPAHINFSNDDGVAAKIVNREFYGEVEQFTVRLDIEKRDILIRSSMCPQIVDEHVRVLASPERVMMFSQKRHE